MQPIATCNRCRGIEVGLNARYLVHFFTCRGWVSGSSKLFIICGIILATAYGFSTAGPSAFSDLDANPAPGVVPQLTPAAPAPSVSAIGTMLEPYDVEETHLLRVAEAVVRSSRKYNIDPKLVASILILESRADPFAISPSESIGVMQIHLPTWSKTVDRENINLFKIEDNVDFGVRILKGYVQRYGLWDGVKRYKGWTDAPESEQSAEAYVRRVQRIYGYRDSNLQQPIQE